MQRTLWKLRAFYFLTGLSGGLFVPYLSMLLVHNGLSSSAVGQVMAAGTLAAILAQPAWGWLVDHYRATRITLALSSLIPGIAAVLFNLPWLWLVTACNVLSNIFSSPQAPITDAYAVATARALGTSYGTIRCLASLGFATGGYVGGSYIAHLPLSTLWLPYAGAGLAGALVALSLPRQDVGVAVGGSFQEGLVQLIRNKRFLVFLLGGLLVSQTLTAFNTYFALTFRAMGGSLTWTGVAFFLASATNVPAMLVASRVIRRLGREPMMALAALAYLLRWGIQALVPHPAVAVAVQALHGLSFGFYYVAAVDFVFTTAPRQLQATAQSLFGMVSGGVAGILGNLMNGWLLQLYGAQWMYVACTLSAAAGAVCFWTVRWLGRPTTPHPRWGRGSHNPSPPWTGYR